MPIKSINGVNVSAGSPGADGSPGINGLPTTTTTSEITIPTTGSTVVVDVASQLISSIIGQNVFISDGTYLIHGIITAASTLTITVRALGFTGDTAATGTIASGANITIDFGQVNTLWYCKLSGDVVYIDTPTLDNTVAGDLEIIFAHRLVTGYSSDEIRVSINGDTTNGNYRDFIYYVYANGVDYITDNSVGWRVYSPGNGSPAYSGNPLGVATLTIPNYTGTARNISMSQFNTYPNGNAGALWIGYHEYRGSAGALTSMRFTGSSIASGSIITIRRKRYI